MESAAKHRESTDQPAGEHFGGTGGRVDADGLGFAVLGPLTVRRGTEVLPVGPPQQGRLLALLAVQANRPVRREALIEALWADRPPVSAVNIVQTYVARLRRVLEPRRPARRAGRVLESTGLGYLLRVEEDQVDALRFERLVRQAVALVREGRPEEAFGKYRSALALWRSPGPAGWWPGPDEPEPVARLARQRMAAALALADVGLPLLRFAPIVDALAPLALVEPLHEALHARLMLALAGAGDPADALLRYQLIRGRLRQDLGVSPSAELRQAHLRILQFPGEPSPPSPVPASDELVGRRDDLALLAVVAAGRPLTTLVGAPGCGKSALALRHAAAVDAAPGSRVLTVGLSGCRGAGELAALVEQTAGRPGAGASPAARVAGVLAAGRAEGANLLVLDDADRLADVVAALVAELRRRCPWLRVLVTSREPLGIVGEAIHQVQPLPVPGSNDLETLVGNDSVALLSRRAQEACGFRLTEGNAAAVAELCRRLDGLPLALELAAACLRTMPIEDVVAGLADRFGLFTMVRRGGPAHHRTLRACLAWSFDRLTADEHAVLLRLSGVDEPVAYRELVGLCAGAPVPTAELPSVVNRLVDASLLSVRRDDNGPRYRVLETVGAYTRLNARSTAVS